MLPRPFRLSNQRDFSRVFRRGVSVSTPLFFLRSASSSLVSPRIGIVVSNKISKKATVRNLIKRRLRAAVKEEHHRITHPADIVIIAKPSIVDASYEDIHTCIIKSFSQADYPGPAAPRPRL